MTVTAQGEAEAQAQTPATPGLPPEAWNPPPGAPVRAETVHGLFDWCVERWPDRPAVRHGARRITYAELSAVSFAYAARLAELGVGPGHQVPVLMPKSPELLAVLLAVARRGAAYAALDPRWPAERLNALIERLDAPVAVVAEGSEPSAEPGSGAAKPVWSVPEADFGALAAAAAGPAPVLPAPVAVTGDDECAVFFPSGSTGTPKGGVHAHRGNVRLFDAWEFAPVGRRTVMPQSLAATWDAFGLDSWGVLLGGGEIILLQDTVELARRLRPLIAEDGVDTVFLPTAVFHMVVDNDLDAFTGLRVVGTGGERLSPGHARRFVERHPGIPLHNMYGPVECTIAATEHIVRVQDCDEQAGVPIGRPFPNTGVHILDGERPCAIGETGEICLSGAGLALGYLDAPELTAQRFVTVPVGPDATPTAVYRTGDLGHWSAEGLIHFDGRADRQVKIRGHRIELDDVERNARQVEGVGSCAVIPLPGPDGGYQDLCLFFVPVGTMDADTLRAVLTERLPAYLVPGRIHALDRLPVLEDRKVDRKALLALAADLRGRGADGDQPQGAAEARVAAVFAEVLAVDAVARDASFFALGGTSLTAALLCSKLEAEFSTSLKLGQVFDAPTVRGLAELLAEADVEG